LEDDTGFVTCGSDHSVFLWKLYQDKQADDTNAVDTRVGQPVWEYKQKNNSFNCVAIYRPDGDDPDPVVYATCTDKSVREIKTTTTKKETTTTIAARESASYTEGTTYNQVLTSFQRKFLVCGTADQDRPASIQIFRQNFEKVLEVQAHSKQIQRMALSFNNDKLFTVGEDGVLAAFHIVDKEQKKKDGASLPLI